MEISEFVLVFAGESEDYSCYCYYNNPSDRLKILVGVFWVFLEADCCYYNAGRLPGVDEGEKEF